LVGVRRRWGLELRLLLRARAVTAGSLILLVAGVLAIAHGHVVIGRQMSALESRSRLQAAEHQRILDPLPPTANAGDQLYYLTYHTARYPSPWATLAIGQRDVHPFNLKIRLLALQGQLYDVDLGNPLLAAFGHFDLAFVLVVLVPLLVVAITYNVHSAEVEGGTWSLLRSQPVSTNGILAIRCLLRAFLVWLPMVGLLLLATLWSRVPLDGRWWLVTAGALAYTLTWVGAALAVAALRRSSDFNLLALLGIWVVWTALGPAMLNVVAASRYPLPEAMELTVLQRQGYHGAWDEPLPEVMEAFYRRYPEWRSFSVPRDRYSNAWYYAMQQRGDEMAEQAARRYRQGLEAKDKWLARLSWICPPAAFHRLLTRVARTDLTGHLAYLDSVAAYHEALKRHYLPVIFSEQTVADVDWTAAPRHFHRD
jgi:ABC-2 type transport system permease protein